MSSLVEYVGLIYACVEPFSGCRVYLYPETFTSSQACLETILGVVRESGVPSTDFDGYLVDLDDVHVGCVPSDAVKISIDSKYQPMNWETPENG